MDNKVELITIGDEILIGQIVDTNSAWLGRTLGREGFSVTHISSVPDAEGPILEAFAQAFARASVVLVTGGLGPTKDDITKKTLCKYFGSSLVFSEEAFNNVQRQIANRPNAMNDLNRSQAHVPDNCKVLTNSVGTAPIMWFEVEGKVLVSMPGVPAEMKAAMSSQVLPLLAAHFSTPKLLHRTFIVSGYSETQLALLLHDWEAALPAFLHLAYLPQTAYMRLRITGQAADGEKLQQAMGQQSALLRKLLGINLFAEEDITPDVLLAREFTRRGWSLATAESCTGGNIGHTLTLIPGSSAFYRGGIISYTNEVKHNVLGVSQKDLDAFGAVSQPVAEQMAQGAQRLTGATFAVSTTGIAGPGGGTPETPVGTVWMAVSDGKRTLSRCYHFGAFRDRNINKATFTAFFLLKEFAEF